MMSTAIIIAADPMTPQPYCVRDVAKETPDTFTLTLQPENGTGRSSFQPGQFSMLWVFGVGELPISISGDPGKQDHLVYTVRSVGKATHALVSQKAGAGVGVRGPFGTGWPVDAARGRDLIMVAGGIGLAPLRPVIYHVLSPSAGLWAAGDSLWRAQSSRSALPQGTGGWARQRDTQVLVTVDYGGLSWRRPCGRRNDVVQVRAPAARPARWRCFAGPRS